MAADNDYPVLAGMAAALTPDHRPSDRVEAEAALDELDRLRAELATWKDRAHEAIYGASHGGGSEPR